MKLSKHLGALGKIHLTNPLEKTHKLMEQIRRKKAQKQDLQQFQEFALHVNFYLKELLYQ